jgi:prepilin signal peptidase PulO-like enzyme (type II secretory pathway)
MGFEGLLVNNAIEFGILIAGLVLGSSINHAIYAWAYFPRAIDPWQRRPEGLPHLPWPAYLPVLGWFWRGGESSTWGKGFWIRPLLIEVSIPILLVALYRAMMNGLTIPFSIRVPAAGHVAGGLASGGGGVTTWELHTQYVAYCAMLVMLTVATFIDIDEKTIPDAITVPGTWLGLLASGLLPGWTLWEVRSLEPSSFVKVLEPLHVNSPFLWERDWGQVGLGGIGLWIGCGIWLMWCVSLGNLRWIGRRGVRKAWVYAWAGFWRSPNLALVFGMAGVGAILIATGYALLPADRWQSLFSSLMGLGLGGLLVWSFRIVSGLVMRQEALGFGDVTLMAMVGAHFGWQIVFVAFFLAPIFGLVLVIAYWTITRDTAIPFGPFLASATAYLMLDWARVWDTLSIYFLPLHVSLWFLLGLLGLLGFLLWIVGILKVLVGGWDNR